LLVVGGAPGYFGAPRLAGEAALRAGCGYVGLAAPRSIIGPIASAVPELIFHPLSEADGRTSAATVGKALAEGKRYNTVVIGPGLGRDEVATRFLDALFTPEAEEESTAPPSSAFGIPRRTRQRDEEERADLSEFSLVLDADALNWLAGLEDWPKRLQGRTCVLTPHVGEMARLLDVEPDDVAADPWHVARKAAADWDQVVLLKGPLSCVASPDGQLLVAPRLTPELATPGTGDVLAGTVGAFIAQGLSPIRAAALALFVGSTAGAMARLEHGTRGVLARDLIANLGGALAAFDSPAVRRLSKLR
jgi:NAD(P)H-hydrate epimerase